MSMQSALNCSISFTVSPWNKKNIIICYIGFEMEKVPARDL